MRVIVGFPPGGAADQIARIIAQPLQEALGQPVVVENRAAAGGNIGADAVAKPPPTSREALPKEFLATLKANPGRLSFGTPGSGSSPHLTAGMMKAQSGTIATHIPYRGAAPAMQDLVAGQIDFMFDPGIGLNHVRAGRLKMLAVGSPKRSAKDRITALGGEALPLTPQEFGNKAADDSKRFGALISERKIIGD